MVTSSRKGKPRCLRFSKLERGLRLKLNSDHHLSVGQGSRGERWEWARHMAQVGCKEDTMRWAELSWGLATLEEWGRGIKETTLKLRVRAESVLWAVGACPGSKTGGHFGLSEDLSECGIWV